MRKIILLISIFACGPAMAASPADYLGCAKVLLDSICFYSSSLSPLTQDGLMIGNSAKGLSFWIYKGNHAYYIPIPKEMKCIDYNIDTSPGCYSNVKTLIPGDGIMEKSKPLYIYIERIKTKNGFAPITEKDTYKFARPSLLRPEDSKFTTNVEAGDNWGADAENQILNRIIGMSENLARRYWGAKAQESNGRGKEAPEIGSTKIPNEAFLKPCFDLQNSQINQNIRDQIKKIQDSNALPTGSEAAPSRSAAAAK
ncbi:hypothetical protein WDW37_19135 [Bdellovibrionota bacterium FG-1]